MNGRAQIVSQDSPDGVSRIGGQAGTQAPDPTPVSSQNRGSRAGSTIHTLPADYLLSLMFLFEVSVERISASSGFLLEGLRSAGSRSALVGLDPVYWLEDTNG